VQTDTHRMAECDRFQSLKPSCTLRQCS